MNKLNYTPETIIKSLERLPQESLLELAKFIEYLEFKYQGQDSINQQQITLQESEQLTDELLKEMGDNLPSLSDYAVSRAGIYEEHD